MRQYGSYHYSTRQSGHVEVGATHVTVTVPHTSTIIIARILDRTIDQRTGATIGLLLDRRVGDRHCTAVGEWSVAGPFVSELTRSPPRTMEDPPC